MINPTVNTNVSNSKKEKNSECIRQIPWFDLYIMMGDTNDECLELFKFNRICTICAQCIKCSNMSTFCDAHKKCKHKRTQVDKDYLLQVIIPKIKAYNRLKSCS